jgi:hypothetical protein
MAQRWSSGTLAKMQRSYAVMWKEADGLPRSGKLELRLCGVSLEGANRDGPLAVLIPYGELLGLRMASPAERLAGRPTLVLDRRRGTLRIASIDAPGIIHEITEQVETMRNAISSQRLAVIVPVRKGKRDKAERLLAKGPPFDAEHVGLERHEVFLGERDAIFVFDATSDVSLEKLLADAKLWTRAAAWHDVVAGPPRLVRASYAWEAIRERDDLFFAPTPGPGDSEGGNIYSP